MTWTGPIRWSRDCECTAMSGGPQQAGEKEFSGFEVVANPADKWPEWSLWIVSAGLGIHFMTKLFGFVLSKGRRPVNQTS